MVRASANYPNSNNLNQLNSDSRLGAYEYRNNNSSASQPLSPALDGSHEDSKNLRLKKSSGSKADLIER